MKPLLVGLLALIFVVGVAWSQVPGQQYSSNWGIISLIGLLIIISSLFGNQGTDFRVVVGNFSSKDVTTGRK